MEGHQIESGFPVVSPTLHASSAVGLCAKPRDRGKTPPFLSNLGKPTLRGIRKCPHCGIYNGTRGLSCKNKACGVVFRDGASTGGQRVNKKSSNAASEVIRVVTDGGGGDAGGASSSPGTIQIFSVRQRGRGPEQRGFVELTLTDTAIATTNGTLLTRLSLGRCFLPSCQRQQQQGKRATSSSSSQTPDSPCGHIRQAMECQASQVATPLPLKSSVLEALQVSAQTRQELWRLATESPGPLVQRVSRGSLVVKCQCDETHPLGLLHCNVGGLGGLKGDRGGLVFRCACQQNAGVRGALGPKSITMQDGSSHDNKEMAPPDIYPVASPTTGTASEQESELCLHFYACVCAFASDDKLAAEFADILNYSSHAGSSAGAGGPSILRKPSHRKQPISTGHKASGNTQPVDESHVSLPFQQWLASVTERIHQTMHYQFDGKPEPLVFHIPQAFFNALQQRLSLGSKKRRLPNLTTEFVRHDALPLGSFCKYTWHITNLMQVKRIFDTPELPLKLTQSFVRNSDGSYSPFQCPEVPSEPQAETYSRAERPQPIRPMELRTFLQVGMFAPGQKEPTPFVIEWIPDILPVSRVGELRLRFEYGHQRYGQPEHGERTATGETIGEPSVEIMQSQRRSTAVEVLHVTV
ncbi:uncharacterized protein C2orf42 homolog isoform X2 [Denticeps clupeoides]|uniref:Putative treble-clef zinc-finger domain-containing protein n=1 Tax=Denticeps clupeoides TaxID=299321 RepID=A0AAY4ANB2_9TELE|nr:uncharacterized protein C2orf42 homolog isoform X2 [Denticeps clupeoides]